MLCEADLVKFLVVLCVAYVLVHLRGIQTAVHDWCGKTYSSVAGVCSVLFMHLKTCRRIAVCL